MKARNNFIDKLDNLFDIVSAENNQVSQNNIEFIKLLKENKRLGQKLVEECEITEDEDATAEQEVQTKQGKKHNKKEIEFSLSLD